MTANQHLEKNYMSPGILLEILVGSSGETEIYILALSREDCLRVGRGKADRFQYDA